MKAAFLDRDGTVIINKHYLSTPEGVEFMPNAVEGLQRFMAQGYVLFIITNQSGIARGYFTEQTLHDIHDRMERMLAEHGVRIEKIYYCPHGPNDGCTCRKPLTGMLEQACKDYPIDREHSVMIGDSKEDIKLGNAFGIRTIQVENSEKEPTPDADFHCKDLLEAANLKLF